MRIILEGQANAELGTKGTIRIELSRHGLPVVHDERDFKIVEAPPARPGGRRVSFPQFEVRPVEGPEAELWTTLGWPDNIYSVASSAVMEEGKLIIYYSTAYPKFAQHRASFASKDHSLADSFTKRYEIWLAVHSLLLYQDQQQASAEPQLHLGEATDAEEKREREERCRIAILSTLFAAREVLQSPIPVEVETEE